MKYLFAVTICVCFVVLFAIGKYGKPHLSLNATKTKGSEAITYGHVSRFNVHNAISIEFLEASCIAQDSALAKKVYLSVKNDLNQQMKYYQSFEKELKFEQAYLLDELEYGKFLESLSPDLLPLSDEIVTCHQLTKKLEAIRDKYAYLK